MAEGPQVLTLDSRLTDPRAENASYASTRTLLEHQVVLWRPRGLLDRYDTSTQYRGCTCLSDNGTANFLRDEKRRAREMHDYLALGRLIVVLVPPPITFYVATGETQNEGTAAKPRIRRIVTARSVGGLIPGGATLTAASGTSFKTVGDSSFSAFWNAVGDQFSYVSILDGVDTPLLTIKGTEHVVAGLVTVESGKVLLLPERYFFGPSDDFAEEVEDKENEEELWDKEQERIDRECDGDLLDALFELANDLVDGPNEALPSWSERFLLPRESDAVLAVEKAAQKADSALQAVEQANLDLVETRKWKRLVSGTGSELERAVEAALAHLGCTVDEGEAGRADRIVRWKKKVAVIEVKGLTKSAGEKNAAQLEKWVSEYTVDVGTPPKGLLVVNAWRSAPLDERDKPAFPDQMLAYSEQRNHCLLTTAQLLAAIAAGTSVKKREAFIKGLFETKGVLQGWNWDGAITVVSDSDE